MFHADFTHGDHVIMFGAKWCQPCKSFTPVAEELTKQAGLHLSFTKVDVEEEPDMTSHFNIRGVPCVILLRNGQELARLNVASADQLRKLIINCFDHL